MIKLPKYLKVSISLIKLLSNLIGLFSVLSFSMLLMVFFLLILNPISKHNYFLNTHYTH